MIVILKEEIHVIKKIRFWAEYDVKPGCIDQLREVAQQQSQWAEDGEPGSLAMNWYLSPDEGRLYTFATEEDMDATWFHSKRQPENPFAEPFAELVETRRMCRYGPIDDKYKELMSKINHDADRAERLIEFEKQFMPNATRRTLIESAIQRWDRDNS